MSTTEHGVFDRQDDNPERPDRNLALELVRVTEAAALAAARWVGRGDKEAADQAAVDAMRLVLDTVPMDGVVVIGEGEKDEAPMLYNGEQIGDGSPPAGRHRRRPARGHDADRAGACRSALAVIALAERGSMFDPGPVRLHGEDRRRPTTSPTCSTSTARSRRRSALIAERRASTSATSWSSCSTARATTRAIEAIRDGRRARPPHHRRRRLRPRCSPSSDRSPVDLLWGIGGTPEGVISAARDQVHRRRAASAACGRATTRSARRALDAGYDLDRVLDHDDLVTGDDCFFSRHRRDRRRRPAGRALPGRRAARRPSRSSCARARAPCAASHATHDRTKLRALTGERYG